MGLIPDREAERTENHNGTGGEAHLSLSMGPEAELLPSHL